MPNLLTTIKPYDLGMLRIIAGFWGLPAPAGGTEKDRAALADEILDAGLAAEIVRGLPPEAGDALVDLVRNGGRIPWLRLIHAHGDVRQMGPARRDRERPHERPGSALETLFYRALLGRAFFDTDTGPQEFGYIPDDLLPRLPGTVARPAQIPGRPARDDEASVRVPATDEILDDLATLLAAVRTGRGRGAIPDPFREGFYLDLLAAAGILTKKGAVHVDRARDILEAPRAKALAVLVGIWQGSPSIDELSHVPDIEIAARFAHDPVRLRQRILICLDALPEKEWWSLNAFTAGIEALEPEFLRPGGELDNRYVKDRKSGEFLEASPGWEAVEGAFIRWMLTGPIHWLGLVDLAGRAVEKASRGGNPAPQALRVSRWSAALRAGAAPGGLPEEDQPVHVRSDGRISVPRLAPRAVRYLIARFCDWEEPVRDEYRYRPSPGSLQRASDEGLKVGQLIALLARHAGAIPPNVTKALKSWEQHGRAARIETSPVLRLPSAEALEELRRSRAARFLGDSLGPAAVALKPGTEARVLAALNELGYLAEIVGREA